MKSTFRPILFSLAAGCVSFMTLSSGSAQEFARSYGLPGARETIHETDKMPDGGLILAGTIDDGETWATAMKLDAAGNYQWRRTFQSAGLTTLRGATALSDGDAILVGMHAASLSSDLHPWVMRVDRVGVPVWQITTSERRGEFKTALRAVDGSIYVAGEIENRFGAPMMNVAKVTPSGQLEWQFGYGTNINPDYVGGLCEMTDGSLLLSGLVNDRASLLLVNLGTDGRPIWSRSVDTSGEYDFNALPKVSVASNGDLLLVAGRKRNQSLQNNLWVMRLTPQGNRSWEKEFDFSEEYASHVQALPDGGFVIAGTTKFNGQDDVIAIRTDANGEPRWRKLYGGPDDERLTALTLTDQGHLCFVAQTKSFGTGDDLWVVRTDLEGDVTRGFPYSLDVATYVEYPNSPVSDMPMASDYAPSRTNTAVATVFTGAEQTVQATTNDLQWSDMGNGLPGTHGIPHLGGTGTLRNGRYVGMALTAALENSILHLFIGTEEIDAPFLGGTLVPNPELILLALPSGGRGTLTIDAEWPGTMPPGITVYVQAMIADPNSPVGYAFSNAIRGMAP